MNQNIKYLIFIPPKNIYQRLQSHVGKESWIFQNLNFRKVNLPNKFYGEIKFLTSHSPIANLTLKTNKIILCLFFWEAKTFYAILLMRYRSFLWLSLAWIRRRFLIEHRGLEHNSISLHFGKLRQHVFFYFKAYLLELQIMFLTV